MSTRQHLEFIDQATVARKASSAVARLGTLGDVTQRATSDLADFAMAEVKQLASKMGAVAMEGEPDDAEFRAALLGKDGRFNARLEARTARAQAYREQAEAEDVEVAARLREVKQRATSLVMGEAQSPSQGAIAALFSAVVGSMSAPPPAPPPPDDMQRLLVEAAVGLVYVEAGRGLAEMIDARVSARNAELRRYRRSSENVQKALKGARGAVSGGKQSNRLGTLPFDLVLDGPEAVKRLLRTAAPVDWSEIVLAHGGDLDEATAQQLVEKCIEDVVKVYQRPFPELLSILLGDRSVEQALDTFVRNGSPFAPLRPHEVPDRFTGLSIGVVEARDEGLAAILASALRRARDVAVLTVRQPDLPADDIQARVVRFRGILPSEALVSVVLDLYERTDDPASLGGGATRDWEGEIPALVSDARLQREIRARKMRGSQTAQLERWLPAGTAPVPEPTSISVDDYGAPTPPSAGEFGSIPEAK